jgi:hypothetical protein
LIAIATSGDERGHILVTFQSAKALHGFEDGGRPSIADEVSIPAPLDVAREVFIQSPLDVY